MMGAVATRRDISDPQKSPEGVVVERVSRKEVFVIVVPGSSPEVTDLLGLDFLITGKGRAIKRRSGNLKDR